MEEELCVHFKEYLEELGYSRGVRNFLPRMVSDFLDYSGQRIGTIGTREIRDYYTDLQTRKHKRKGTQWSEAYLYAHVYALRVFYEWLEKTDQIAYNPMSVLRFKHPKSPQRVPLTEGEIKLLFASATNLKEEVLLHLFYSCGLRRSEGEQLNVGDVHFGEQLLYVREGKGRKRRVVPMPQEVSNTLERYLKEGRKSCDTASFVVNEKGHRMRGDSYNKQFKHLLERSGITKEVSLHHLRHSIATHLLSKGLEVEKVREFLGHSSLDTTQIYAKVMSHKIKELCH